MSTVTSSKTPCALFHEHYESAARLDALIKFQANLPEASKASDDELEKWKSEREDHVLNAIAHIQTDPELKALIPPLLDAERLQLRENLIAEGVRDPLVLWHVPQNDTLILLDGHNRLDTITEEALFFHIELLQFESRLEAKAWMMANQLGRRNLSKIQRSVLLGDYYNATKAAHGGGRREKSEDGPGLSRAEEIAQEHNVSDITVKRAGKIAKGVERLAEQDPEAKTKALTRTDISQSDLADLADAPAETLAAVAEALVNDEPLPKPEKQQLGLVEYIEQMQNEGDLADQAQRDSIRKKMTSSLTDEHATPQELFEVLNQVFYFTLDVAASAENAKCERYFDIEINALEQSWAPLGPSDIGAGWMNHPYSQHYEFLQKAFLTAMNGERTMVCLVKVDTRTKWWWDFCRFGLVRFLEGGLVFGEAASGAPFPNAIVIFPKDMATNPKYKPSTTYWDWAGKRQAKLTILSKANFHANKAIVIDDTVFAPGTEGNWGRWQTEPALYKGKGRLG